MELKKVEKAEDLPVVVHGTYFRLWDSICKFQFVFELQSFITDHSLNAAKDGLKTMTRNHIHCAVGLAGDDGVISGKMSTRIVVDYRD